VTSRARQIRQLIAEEGALKTARYALAFVGELASDWVMDRRLGIRTTARMSTEELGLADPCSEKYAPSDYRSVQPVLDWLSVGADDEVFLDYGSGKGRMLILAGRLPFRRILGIELSEDLNRLARENLRRASPHLRCPDIEVIAANAADFEVPADVTVAYFYSPFTGRVLEAALDNLRRSWEAAPRRLRLVFKDPADFETEVRRHRWLAPVQEFRDPSKHDRTRYVVYEAGPEPPA